MDEKRVIRRIKTRLVAMGISANLGGAVILYAFIVYLLPSELAEGQIENIGRKMLPIFVGFTMLASPAAWYVALRLPLQPIDTWIAENRSATEAERYHVLTYPRTAAVRLFAIWLAGSLGFTLLNPSIGAWHQVVLFLTATLSGAGVVALQYLTAERIIRPLTEMVLGGHDPEQIRGVPGVGARLLMAWLLVTGVPLIGIVFFAGLESTVADYPRDKLVGAVLVMALFGLALGAAAMVFAANSVTDPVEEMQRAMGRVEDGDYRTRVEVYDGTEIGLLQAGFNRLVEGLEERERLRAAFGAYVDPSITERVIAEGIDLAGEEVVATLLFVDVENFTSFAEKLPARAVLAKLNDLYGEVVPVVLKHGGHANKFIGDGLLAVFGAPDRLADHAAAAVAAGLEIIGLVRDRYQGALNVGVGINTGKVVVGTLGGGGRLDFTVIGDPVNTAARVEKATRVLGDRLLITGATRDQLPDLDDWVSRPSIKLRGKSEEVALFAPPGSKRNLSRLIRRSIA